ncbi:metallophosphoesterase [Acetobacter sp. DsW_063]|uniref:metallophosphoesterase family protein n=1 Tax=Acetobacter sp. DsW_063 TaxID=1514894 RepID=UPI000A3BC15B|nr:metallophosphoesterase [Acetobacter sp. DsW_063]
MKRSGNTALSAVLAHLSDPHLPLRTYPGVRELMSKRALSLLSWGLRRRFVHREGPLAAVLADIEASAVDALAVTGDLTNLGTGSEFRAAAAWLRRFDRPVAVIPGNHDAMVPIAWNEGPGLWADLGGMADPGEPAVTTVGRVALVGINSAIPTPPFMAGGRIGREQAERLIATLHRLRTEGLCRIVMIHHPPRPGLVVPRKALWDAGMFAEAIAEAGAELVLHGHSHRGTDSVVPGSDTPLIGVTSASHSPGRLDRAAGWNRIVVEPVERRADVSGVADASLSSGRPASSPAGSGLAAWRIGVERRRLGTDGRLHVLPHLEFLRPCAESGIS